MVEKGHRKVILIDNSSEYRRSLRSFLELYDYYVQEASGVREAKTQLETASVDLALVDLRLARDDDANDFSGLEVAQFASQHNVRCIVVSAFPSIQATRRALRSRGIEAPLALDFIPKATGPQAILDAIEIVLGQNDVPSKLHGEH